MAHRAQVVCSMAFFNPLYVMTGTNQELITIITEANPWHPELEEYSDRRIIREEPMSDGG